MEKGWLCNLAENVEYKVVKRDKARLPLLYSSYLTSQISWKDLNGLGGTRFLCGCRWDVRLKTRNDVKSVKGSIFLYVIPGSLVTVLPQSSEKVKDIFVEKVNQIDSKHQGYLRVWKVGAGGRNASWKWGDRQHAFQHPVLLSSTNTSTWCQPFSPLWRGLLENTGHLPRKHW